MYPRRGVFLTVPCREMHVHAAAAGRDYPDVQRAVRENAREHGLQVHAEQRKCWTCVAQRPPPSSARTSRRNSCAESVFGVSPDVSNWVGIAAFWQPCSTVDGSQEDRMFTTTQHRPPSPTGRRCKNHRCKKKCDLVGTRFDPNVSSSFL